MYVKYIRDFNLLQNAFYFIQSRNSAVLQMTFGLWWTILLLVGKCQVLKTYVKYSFILILIWARPLFIHAKWNRLQTLRIYHVNQRLSKLWHLNYLKMVLTTNKVIKIPSNLLYWQLRTRSNHQNLPVSIE